MKRFKKVLVWITVSAGFIIAVLLLTLAVMNTIWGAELRKTITEIKARGEPMTIAEIVPAYVSPEKNAAVEFHKVFALMCGDKLDEQYIPFKQPGKLKPNLEALNNFYPKMKQASADEIKKNLELVDSPEFSGIFDALNAAALKPGCNYDLKYEDGVEMLFPNLGIHRAVARLQCLKALCLANKGNIAGACDILMTNIKISNHLQAEPSLIFQLVRMAYLQMTTESLDNIADNFQIPEVNAKIFITELEKINTTEPLKKSFIAERICFGQTIFDKVISEKKVYDYLDKTKQANEVLCMGYSILKPFIKRDYCEYLRIMSLYPKVCDKPFYLSGDEIKKIETDIRRIPHYCLLSGMFIPNLTGIFKNNAAFQTKLAISKIKLALVIYKSRHAAFPENLEQLKPEIIREIPIDQLTGNPLTYKKEGDKYVLFSAAVQKLEEERERDREKYKREQAANQKKVAGK